VFALILLTLLSKGHADAQPMSMSEAERCQLLVAAISGDDGLMNSEECARRWATDKGKVLVDPVVKRDDARASFLLPDGTTCGTEFLVVRSKARARVSKRSIGYLRVEFTPKSNESLGFYATLEILEAKLASSGTIGCGAERFGILEKAKGSPEWVVTVASERPRPSVKSTSDKTPNPPED
jgi:hypothetical protein